MTNMDSVLAVNSLENGESATMSQLQVGSQVQTGRSIWSFLL